MLCRHPILCSLLLTDDHLSPALVFFAEVLEISFVSIHDNVMKNVKHM